MISELAWQQFYASTAKASLLMSIFRFEQWYCVLSLDLHRIVSRTDRHLCVGHCSVVIQLYVVKASFS